MQQLLDPGPRAPLSSLYVHVPFCRDRCTYCSFTTVADDAALHGTLVQALLDEGARHARAGAFAAAPLETLYLGGGTPGLLAPDALATLVHGLRRLARGTPQLELTLEANPSNVTPEALAHWDALGINRLSLGVQTFRDDVLHALARRHDAADARRALACIRERWTHTWSADLLVGWAGQRVADLAGDLRELLAFEPPHVSVYGLTLEPRTPLERQSLRGERVTAPAIRLPAFDRVWTATLTAAGLERYEISNFSRPGHRSRHNQAYWSNASYLGLGPGASSSVHPWRWMNRTDTGGYLRAVAAGHGVRVLAERVSPAARLLETLFCGLRTSDGLRLAELDARFSPAWRAAVAPNLASLLAQGFLEEADGRLTVASAQRPRLDAVLRELISPLSGDAGAPENSPTAAAAEQML